MIYHPKSRKAALSNNMYQLLFLSRSVCLLFWVLLLVGWPLERVLQHLGAAAFIMFSLIALVLPWLPALPAESEVR